MESGYRSEDVERQKAAVEAARAELARATTNLQDTELFAPQDGVVLTRVHEIGAVVQGGQTVYTVTLNNPVWIRAYVTQPNLGNIRPGQEVLLSIDATPDKTYRGRIGFISPTPNSRRRPWKPRKCGMIWSSVSASSPTIPTTSCGRGCPSP